MTNDLQARIANVRDSINDLVQEAMRDDALYLHAALSKDGSFVLRGDVPGLLAVASILVDLARKNRDVSQTLDEHTLLHDDDVPIEFRLAISPEEQI